MDQPLIFRKQIYSLAGILFVTICCRVLGGSDSLIMVLVYYFILILSITFVPSLKKRLNYSPIVHTFIYYAGFLLPVLSGNARFDVTPSWSGFLIGGSTGIILLASNLRHMRIYISEQNYITAVPLGVLGILDEVIAFTVCIISEEVFFRLFLTNQLSSLVGYYVIILSAIVFTLTHYLNRWANVIFNKRSYVYHMILGLCLGLIYYNTNSLFACIIAHAIFNCPDLIVLHKRYRADGKHTESLFDDY